MAIGAEYRWGIASSDLYLGVDPSTDIEIGMKTPRHAITFAGSRSGKGAACIIPNLKLWQHNSLTIDPKGEAAEQTIESREKFGFECFVVDPFNYSSVEERHRASYNPLAELDINSPTISADINIISEGLMMRHDPKHGRWDNKAKLIISGLIAFVKSQEEPEFQNLMEVRNFLRTVDLFEFSSEMEKHSECDGLMQAAAAAIQSPDGKDFIDTAQANTEWLDVAAFASCMSGSDFSLGDLKKKRISIFLVLPPDYLDEYGRFLRLFVRVALGQMSKKLDDGRLLGERCLFILDEFYSLGHMKIIQTASGQMPGMGVHLWPFLQDLGQLTSLYGKDGADTFFGNADLHQFFANTDQTTLKYMSEVSGTVLMRDIGAPPSAIETQHQANPISAAAAASQGGLFRTLGVMIGVVKDTSLQKVNTQAQAQYETEMNLFRQRASREGRQQYSPDEMAEFVQRKEDDVANLMFCVCNGADKFFIKPRPYYRKNVVVTEGERVRKAQKLRDHIDEEMQGFKWGLTFKEKILSATVLASVLFVLNNIFLTRQDKWISFFLLLLAVSYFPAIWLNTLANKITYKRIVKEKTKEFNKSNF